MLIKAKELKAKFQITGRETEIIEHVLMGETNREIAHALYITENTLKRHISNIYNKLGVSNKMELLNCLKDNGLVSQPALENKSAIMISGFDFTNDELSSIDTFRKTKNTSVLTIMFTDIEGYTRLTDEKGEKYSNMIREYHDEILVSTIQERNAGLVIKFIGDAVMAVFSEPTLAVERALAVQEKLREFNAMHPEFEDIKVRIGLHMGQVIIWNKIHSDVFGSHVNQASRVESAAQGGQIYCTYSVFDSVKGWILDQEEYGWHNHGAYFLKGIKLPIEIYEVFNKEQQKPRAPKKLRKKRPYPLLLIPILVLILALTIILTISQFQRPTIYLSKVYGEEVYVDYQDRLILEGADKARPRLVVQSLKPGPHLLHYDVAKGVRYYAAIEVARGENNIELSWEESRLPGMYLHAYYKNPEKRSAARSRETEYILFDSQLQKITHRAICQAQVAVTQSPDDPDTFIFTVEWALELDGEVKKSGSFVDRNSLNKRLKKEAEVVFEDPLHLYYYDYYLTNDAINFNFNAIFSDYK